MKCLIVLMTSLLAGVTHAQFAPGCSFNDGHCMYNVQLGHYGQCDKRAVTSGDSGACCDELKSQMTELVGDVNTLKSQVSTLMSELTASKTNASETLTKLTEEEMKTQQLLQMLAQKEAELNTTQKELSQIISNAANEIRTLRNQAGRLTSELNTCKGMLGLATNTTTLPLSSVLPDDVTLSYCDFESHAGSSDDVMCGFTNTSSSSYMHFSRSSGQHHTQSGPVEDHTLGSPHGHYMFIDSTAIGSHSSSSITKKISMISREYPANQAGYCIRFWYNMHGTNVRDLNVYAKIASGNGYPIFTRSGNSGEQWILGEADLDTEYTHTPFQFVVEATTTAYHYTSYADIAVDDIYVYNTSCKNIPLCPSGSVTRDDAGTRFCYTFHTHPVTWYEAASACRREGATTSLVTVTSQEEQEFIVQTIRNDSVLTAAGQYGFYTAGNDERSEHTFDWTDTGTPYHGSYTNWKVGQPNNVASDQDCLLLQYPELDFQWGDVDCDERHPFICKTQHPTGASGVSSPGSVGSSLIG